MKILLADDDPLWQRLVKATLVPSGHEVLVVSNGEAAWDVLQQSDPPSLALLDWMMPKLDGIDLCRRVREQEPAFRVYVILLTALDEEEAVAQAIEAGADDYLVKPFLPAHLRLRVRIGVRVMELEKTAQQNARALADARACFRRLHELLLFWCPRCGRERRSLTSGRDVEGYIGRLARELVPWGCCSSPEDDSAGALVNVTDSLIGAIPQKETEK